MLIGINPVGIAAAIIFVAGVIWLGFAYGISGVAVGLMVGIAVSMTILLTTIQSLLIKIETMVTLLALAVIGGPERSEKLKELIRIFADTSIVEQVESDDENDNASGDEGDR